MSRIKNKFQDLRSKNQKALIAYVMAGFPNEKDTISAVRGLVKGGADIIELGMPFSDSVCISMMDLRSFYFLFCDCSFL